MLWTFGLTPAPQYRSLLGEVGGVVDDVRMPELEGDTLVRLPVFSWFVDPFPVDVVGEATIERFREEPSREAAAIALDLREGPSGDVLRRLLSRLRIELTTGLPTTQRPDELSRQILPGPDPFVSSWTHDWARRAVIAHGSSTVQGTLPTSWQEGRRQDDRRVGKECGSTCTSRESPERTKKKTK